MDGIGTGFLTATTKPSIVFCPLHAEHGQSLKAGLTFHDVLVFLLEFIRSVGLWLDAFGFTDFKISMVMKPKAYHFRQISG
jgi:hypothetical protein